MTTVLNPSVTSHAPRAAPGVNVRELGKSFGATRAMTGVTFDLRQGEFFCLVGPSGCGKTTLLRILGGLTEPSEGTAHWNLDVSDSPQRGIVFQEQGIFPWMTVLKNAAFGLAVRGVPRREREEIAMRHLRQFGLHRFAERYPHQLSGGMRQRVNLARAFALDPVVLLMDEPLGALDEQTKMLVQRDLVTIWEQRRKTALFITHSLDEAIVLGDRVGVMSRRPGTIKEIVEIDLPRPRDAIALRNTDRFVELRRRVWESLSDEVLQLVDE